MINKIIEYSAKNRLIVLSLFALVIIWGVWALYRTPLDAIPDLSDNQVIVYTEWPGRSPETIEDQVTYPLVTRLQGVPKVRVVRATSAFGFSLIYVIFDDDADIYWARTRVLERLDYASSELPAGVKPALGPDGTGVGQVYWYTLEGDGYDLASLRPCRTGMSATSSMLCPGVSEVASMGGFVKQYEVDLDPNKVQAYHVSTTDITGAIKKSNSEVEGNLFDKSSMSFMVRGLGYIKEEYTTWKTCRWPSTAGRRYS